MTKERLEYYRKLTAKSDEFCYHLSQAVEAVKVGVNIRGKKYIGLTINENALNFGVSTKLLSDAYTHRLPKKENTYVQLELF